MPTTNLRSRLPATVLCLCALMLAASPPAFAQTPWDAQDQTDMWRGLKAQGLIRSPESASAKAANRGKPSASGRLQEVGPKDAAGAELRYRSGHGSGLRTLPTPDATALPDAKVTTDAATPPAPGGPACELQLQPSKTM
ncbi:hypothetical protein H0E84_09045 [Luteimonas sp. SJ-92]|uniref:Uncharacterized protein n=1 Tax=Luteimonas salinisoli TaxID=2752307 RepID=A0A853JBE0_9GAMM|nr:hypothetical protein [Luteimonas salinisoli]NZA26531.1 hypothetical protein [Luteimonas salinisoli]